MRLERLNYNKIKIFLTLDDLSERGLTKEDIWKDSLKWHQLFQEMLEEASEEFDVEIHGSVAVEIFSLQSQGMVMIVTMGEQDVEDTLEDGYIEMKVSIEGNEDILFEFESFENVIQLSKRLFPMKVTGGNLYSLGGFYFLHIDQEYENIDMIVSVMAEYGSPTLKTIHIIKEYGKSIIEDTTISTIIQYFK